MFVDYSQANLTLTRHRMTLTLIRHINNIILNMYTKFEFNPTNGSWSRARTIFSPNHEFDLDLWPYDLDLITNSSPHRCLPPHQVWFHSDSWYMRYWPKRSFVTDGPTDQRTDQRTDGPTNKTIHRDASQSLDASKKKSVIFNGFFHLEIMTGSHSFLLKL